MLDYTGVSSLNLVVGIRVNASMLTNNRLVLEDSVFHADSLKVISPDASPVVVVPEVLYVASSSLSTTRLACVVYFPNGLNKEVELRYQSLGLGDVIKPRLSAYLTAGVFNEHDYYSVFDGKVNSLPVVSGVSSDPVIQSIVVAITAFGDGNRDSLALDLTQRLLEYRKLEALGLQTSSKMVDLGVNELNDAVTSLLTSFNNYQPATDVVLGDLVTAVNSLLDSITGIGPGAIGRMSYGGAITANVDLTPSLNTNSKVWLVTVDNVQVDGRFSGGATAYTFSAGDTVYYSLVSDSLHFIRVGGSLANKQDVVDGTIPGSNLINALNTNSLGLDLLEGKGASTLHGYITTDVNLGLSAPVQEAREGYFVVIAPSAVVTAEFTDGELVKTLVGGDVCTYSPITGKFTLKNVNNFKVSKLPFLDLNIAGEDKTVIGAINKAWYDITNVSGVDILYYDGYLTEDLSLPGPVINSTMWVVNASTGNTIAVSGLWSGGSSVSIQHLYNGDSVLFNKTTGLLYTNRMGTTAENKQSEVDVRLAPLGTNLLYEALNTLDANRRDILGDHPGFVGYVFTDTDLTPLSIGVEDKWWLVAGDCTILGPSGFTRNATLMERISYSGTTGQMSFHLPSVAPMQPSFDLDLLTNDKSFVGAINELSSGSSNASGRPLGSIFSSAATYDILDAIPLEQEYASKTQYPDLYKCLGSTYGEGKTGEIAKWDIHSKITPNTLNHNDIGIVSLAFRLGVGATDWVFCQSGGYGLNFLYNTVTKESIPCKLRIFGSGADKNSDVFYTIGTYGEVHAFSKSQVAGLSLTPTKVFTVALLDGMVTPNPYCYYEMFVDLDSSGNGTITMSVAPAGATNHGKTLYTVNVVGYKTLTQKSSLFIGNYVNGMEGYMAFTRGPDSKIYMLRVYSGGTIPAVKVSIPPYSTITNTSPAIYTTWFAKNLIWSNKDNCYYAFRSGYKVGKLDTNFSLIEEIDFTSVMGLNNLISIFLDTVQGDIGLMASNSKFINTQDLSYLYTKNPEATEMFSLPRATAEISGRVEYETAKSVFINIYGNSKNPPEYGTPMLSHGVAIKGGVLSLIVGTEIDVPSGAYPNGWPDSYIETLSFSLNEEEDNFIRRGRYISDRYNIDSQSMDCGGSMVLPLGGKYTAVSSMWSYQELQKNVLTFVHYNNAVTKLTSPLTALVVGLTQNVLTGEVFILEYNTSTYVYTLTSLSLINGSGTVLWKTTPASIGYRIGRFEYDYRNDSFILCSNSGGSLVFDRNGIIDAVTLKDYRSVAVNPKTHQVYALKSSGLYELMADGTTQLIPLTAPDGHFGSYLSTIIDPDNGYLYILPSDPILKPVVIFKGPPVPDVFKNYIKA